MLQPHAIAFSAQHSAQRRMPPYQRAQSGCDHIRGHCCACRYLHHKWDIVGKRVAYKIINEKQPFLRERYRKIASMRNGESVRGPGFKLPGDGILLNVPGLRLNRPVSEHGADAEHAANVLRYRLREPDGAKTVTAKAKEIVAYA